MLLSSRSVGLVALFAGLLFGCRTAPETTVAEKLRTVGLELISDEAAGIPENERGRYLPCRVVEDVARPALEAHPAGYLLVGVGPSGSGGRSAVIAALEAWRPGEVLELRVRRNPYLTAGTDWWEAQVELRRP